jgi:putative redox protein
MATETVQFKNDEGNTLAAVLDSPDDTQTRACALFAHCFTCSKDLRAVRAISKALADDGIAVLRFDFTGLGESEGDFSDSNFSSNVSDIVAAARFLTAEQGGPSILIGHSLGGAAVLRAAQQLDSVKAVATIGAPADPEHVTHLLSSTEQEIEETGEAEVTLAGRSFRFKKQFLDDLRDGSIDACVKHLNKALMIFHSPVDEIVPIENAATLYRLAQHPKSFVSLDDADHLLSNTRDAKYVARVLAAWADRYVG